MKQAIKTELKLVDQYFKDVTSRNGGFFSRNKFATVPAMGKQPSKEIGKCPDCLIACSYRTNPAKVKPPHYPNQDSFCTYVEGDGNSENPFAILAIMDGHGANGHFVSMIAATQMVKYIHENTNGMTKEMTEDEYVEFLTNAFQAVEEKCKFIDMKMSGATATVVLVSRNGMVQANVGDSTCIVITDSGSDLFSYEDKPTDPAEAARITENGGKVIQFSGCGRVFPVGLAITRAIGDLDGEQYGIVATPHVLFRKGSPSDPAVLIASDGIWDEITPKQIRKRQMIQNYNQAEHEKIIQECQKRYSQSAGGYADDATFIRFEIAKFFAK
jgi:serine/threonine protein phosphatase PrpC